MENRFTTDFQTMIGLTLWNSLGFFFLDFLIPFVAHALETRLSEDDLSTYETAGRYQMYHALALLLLAAFSNIMTLKESKIIGWSFFLGIILFSGSLYILLLTGISVLGAITPLGGVAFLTGWFYFARFARVKN